VTDVWSSADAYEQYVGRWSRVVAREFLAWLDVQSGSSWIDVGCGTGALTEAILSVNEPASVLGVDSSQAYTDAARQTITDTRASFLVCDAQELPPDLAGLDAAVSGLAINFVPRPEVAVAEMTRVVRLGGTVALYVWDYAGQMQLMRYFWDAATALDPSSDDLDEAARFPICAPDALAELFGNLRDVEVRAIDVPTRFADFDDYWAPFLGGQGAAPAYAMRLSEQRRNELRDRLRKTIPANADGSIDMIARAWAVKGRR
jgi:trans-aconitate methyltransferase